MPLAPVATVLEKRGVQVAVHVGMRALGNVGIHQIAHTICVTVEVFLELLGLIACVQQFVNVQHSTLLDIRI